MSLILEEALLSGADGLVQSGSKIWFHFQKYPWDLARPEQNPGVGDHRRSVEKRLSHGLPDPKLASVLSGTYHLGISPHIYSYYHLLTDLLPHLIAYKNYPVLVPEFMPKNFVNFLKMAKFEVRVLPPDIFIVKRLIIPRINSPDWDSKKVKLVQAFFERFVPKKCLPNSHSSKTVKRIYISRKLAVKRHLSNEDEFLPLLRKYKFTKIYLEKLSIAEQVHLFRSASHVIAPHGAGLTNILFAPSNVKILEIRPVLTSGYFCFQNLFSLGWNQSEFLVPPRRGYFKLPLNLLDEVLTRWQNELKN